MKRKIPMWVMFVILLIIAGTGYIQDEYGTDDCAEERFRADSLQKIVNSFETCYYWKNEGHNY